MKTQKNILIAFILNLFFSVFEIVGGIFTGSIAIISDALHDMGDAMSIGISYFLEKKSKKQPDSVYTYGYMRFSVMGSLITTVILLSGSVIVVYNAIERMINPVSISYDGMIVFAVIGAVVNIVAAWFTKDGDSLNQRAVNLHMLEDVLGWVVVLFGAVIMRFFDIAVLDSLMSIGVAVFIFINALGNLKRITDIFLEKIPDGIDIEMLKSDVCALEGVLGVHHIHVRSLDGYKNYATMHVVAENCEHGIKDRIRQELKKHGIVHVTLELEEAGEHCCEEHCHIDCGENHHHHHHHHHHH